MAPSTSDPGAVVTAYWAAVASDFKLFLMQAFRTVYPGTDFIDAWYIDAIVYALARCRRLSRTEGLDAVFAQHRLDAIVAPTGSPAWTTDLVNGDQFKGASSTPAAVSGYPSICLPMGYSFGLPVGLSFIGKAWSEATVIKLAFAYEQATKHRRAPELLPTARL